MFTLSGILTLVSAQRGYVFLYNKSKKILDLKVYKTITGGGSTGYSKNIINSVFESGKPVLTMDAETDETFDQYNSVVSNRLKSIICVPITIDKRNVGVLYIDNPLAKGVFCEDDIGFLQLLLSHVITVMQGKNSFGDLWGSGIRHLEITDATKSKLDQIVNYLEENYSSEISREALAYSVGMSPNYMSKLFNEYTGKKISIFINELRIKDAEHKLSATEENIIDIAYSVGFESLRTFNRVFLHLKGLTPKEYREIFKFPENEL
jgi:AraC-like DNA-binding protein/putative methionine-R-sulfoxide reductase with GAF domain